jgi:hypothetical protein
MMLNFHGILVIFLLFCHLKNAQSTGKWMIESNNTVNRYQNIFFPNKYTYFAQADVFQADMMFAPKTYFATTKDATDFCSDAKSALNAAQPDIWNNTDLMNPCQAYFCRSTSLPSMPTNATTPHLDNIALGMYNNSHVLHAMAHNWCIKCDGSTAERFDLYVVNNTCPFFSKTLCDENSCAPAHTCVYFTTRSSLCYGPDFHFQTYGGFMDFCVRLRVLGLSYIFLIVNFVLLWVNIFCTAVPEIGSLRRRFRDGNMSFPEKLKAIYGLRNQSMILEIIMNLVYIVGGVVDIINFTDIVAVTTFTGVIQLIHFAVVVYIWSLLIILWMHIYNQTDGQNRSLSRGLNVAWIFATIAGALLESLLLHY